MVEKNATMLSSTLPRIALWRATLLRSPDLVCLVALTLSLPLLLNDPIGVVRVPVGLFIVLIAPGYALMSALFPRRDDIDAVIRGALSVGLSIALIPALALLLSGLPGGIDGVSITIALAVWIIVLSCVAVRRRVRLVATGESVVFESAAGLASLKRPAPVWWTVGIVAIALALTIPALNGLLGSASSGDPTAFYLLGEERQLEYYPRETTTNATVNATIGIVNGAERRQSFRVEVWISKDFDTNAPLLAHTDGPIWLGPAQSQEWPIAWRMPQVGDDQRVDFLLFEGDDLEPSRRLELVLDVVDPSTPGATRVDGSSVPGNGID